MLPFGLPAHAARYWIAHMRATHTDAPVRRRRSNWSLVTTDTGATQVAWCIILHRSHEIPAVLPFPEECS